MSPFNAFLFAQGIETLPLRMRQHVQNAGAIANHLAQHEKVLAVSYPGLPDSRYAPLVDKYLPGGPGAVFCFDLAGGGRTVRSSSAP